MSLERMGRFVGETIGKKIVERLNEKIENFSIETFGQENLEALKNETYLLVANHIKPKNAAYQQSGVSPDSFVLSKIVEEVTDKHLRIVQKSDDGWWSNDPIVKYYQKHIQQPIGTGLVKGIGNIPIKKNPGSFNRDFIKIMDETVGSGDPILIFPEGNWHSTPQDEPDIQPGAADLAKKYNLKIITAFIEGADDWNEECEVKVIFGQPFAIEDLDKQGISETIKNQLISLRQQLNEVG